MLNIKQQIGKCNLQNIIVSFCVFAVCLGTQQMQTVKWDTGIIEFSRDSLGVLMAIIMFTHYKWSDFVEYKLPYIIWTVLGITLGLIFTPMAIVKRLDFLLADTIIISLGIILMGYCIVHTAISFFIEKYRPQFFMPLFVVWVIMMIWMIFSKSEYLWPECYFVLFLCYYLTEQTSTQRTNVMKGVVNGIVLAFIVIQGHSLLTRPYDRLRYYGNFCNPNHNCMFLCICLAAILGKLLFLTKENQKKVVKIFYFLLAEACYSFIFMTQSISGFLATSVITIFFLIAYCRIKDKKIFIRMGMLLVLIFLVVMPLTYLAVRYIPTIHPHVNFYYQEGYSEDRVHSWDERDSEKYISFQELTQSLVGKIRRTVNSLNKFVTETSDESASDELKVVSNTIYFPAATLAYVDTNTLEIEEKLETNPDKIPVLTSKEASNSFVVRYTIYKWYISHLSLRGMPYDEQGFQLTEDHWIQDTHNIYLDYGINFGYPAMILFMVFIWWGIGRLCKQGIKTRNVEKLSSLLLVLVPPIFGMFEFAWGAGMISTVAFYLCFKEMFSY